MFRVAFHPQALGELERIRVFDRRRLLDEIGRHLVIAPDRSTGRTKELQLADGASIRQLRVGDYRVFYDVDFVERLVVIRHVRRKGRRRTEEIL